MRSKNAPAESTSPPGSDATLRLMEEHQIPLTRENYLEMMFCPDPVPDPLPAEYEAMLPNQFRENPTDSGDK